MKITALEQAPPSQSASRLRPTSSSQRLVPATGSGGAANATGLASGAASARRGSALPLAEGASPGSARVLSPSGLSDLEVSIDQVSDVGGSSSPASGAAVPTLLSTLRQSGSLPRFVVPDATPRQIQTVKIRTMKATASSPSLVISPINVKKSKF